MGACSEHSKTPGNNEISCMTCSGKKSVRESVFGSGHNTITSALVSVLVGQVLVYQEAKPVSALISVITSTHTHECGYPED